MADAAGLGVDTDELRARGSTFVRVGDDVEASANRGVLLAHDAYGEPDLSAAAGRFAGRFTYLARGLGEDAGDLGVQMRGAAFAFEELEASVADGFQAMPF